MRSSPILRAVLSASIVLAGAPALARGPAPAPADAEDDAEAKQLFTARKYPEAAVAFEQLHAASPAPKHLFNAAMARELAGHEGHAYLLLRRYLALPDLQPAEVERARDRLAALQRRTAAVRLVTLPDSLTGLEISIERTATGAVGDAGRVPLVLDRDLLQLLVSPDVPGAFDLSLEQGPWVVSARADGHEAVRQELVVDGSQAQLSLTLPALAAAAVAVTASFGPAEVFLKNPGGIEVTLTRAGENARTEVVTGSPVTWQLAPGSYQASIRAPGFVSQELEFTVAGEPASLPPVALAPEPAGGPGPGPKKRGPDPWAVALGVAGGGTAILGAVVLGVGGANLNRTLGRYADFAGGDATNWNVASENLMKSWVTYGAGAGVLGAGVGLGLGAVGMQWLHPRPGARKAWAAGAAVGGVLAVAGGLLVGRAGLGVQNTQWGHAENFGALDGSVRDDYNGKNHQVGAAAALVGFGAGLALSSVLGLVRPKTPRRATAVVPTGTGVVLSGNF